MELLSPAGSVESLRAAVSAGADSIYLGNKDFSARRSAHNFDDEDLAGAISYCHKRGVKVYAAVNTLITDREFKRGAQLLSILSKHGVDGVIVQDLGLARLINKYAPNTPLHASTQMTITTLEGAKAAKDLGFSRVVLARELSQPQIQNICRKSGVEIEVFAHGALCVCYSGQCLMSSIIGGRSGNRGACAQPCRLPYTIDGKNGSLLSLKDLSMISHIDSLKRIGVHCIKIEGRMKGPEYISQVTAMYRKAIDGGEITPDDIKQLESVFYRGGYTDGYFTGNASNSMYAPNKPDNPYLKQKSYKMPSEKTECSRDYQGAEITIPIEQYKPTTGGSLSLAAMVSTKDQLDAVIKQGIDKIYAPPQLYGDDSICIAPNVGNLKTKAASILVSNIGQVLPNTVCEGGFRLNIFNSQAIVKAMELGLTEITLSPELMLAQIRDLYKPIPCNVIAYGRLPLMVLANPPKGREIKDRTGAVFPIINGTLYNSCPIYMGDKLKDLSGAGISRAVLMFTIENGRETTEIIKAYKKGAPPQGEFTRGKFYKGV